MSMKVERQRYVSDTTISLKPTLIRICGSTNKLIYDSHSGGKLMIYLYNVNNKLTFIEKSDLY